MVLFNSGIPNIPFTLSTQKCEIFDFPFSSETNVVYSLQKDYYVSGCGKIVQINYFQFDYSFV